MFIPATHARPSRFWMELTSHLVDSKFSLIEDPPGHRGDRADHPWMAV